MRKPSSVHASTTLSSKERRALMAWILLIVAGILEAGWAIGLKYTDGFTKLVPSVLTIIGIVVSLVLLSIAARTLPIGTAYAVWVGIGAAGAVILGIVLLGEPLTAARLAFLALLLVAIVGLKTTAHG
jgi:quaternary ammonium compound-resistance protein SugE